MNNKNSKKTAQEKGYEQQEEQDTAQETSCEQQEQQETAQEISGETTRTARDSSRNR